PDYFCRNRHTIGMVGIQTPALTFFSAITIIRIKLIYTDLYRKFRIELLLHARTPLCYRRIHPDIALPFAHLRCTKCSTGKITSHDIKVHAQAKTTRLNTESLVFIILFNRQLAQTTILITTSESTLYIGQLRCIRILQVTNRSTLTLTCSHRGTYSDTFPTRKLFHVQLSTQP